MAVAELSKLNGVVLNNVPAYILALKDFNRINFYKSFEVARFCFAARLGRSAHIALLVCSP